MRRRTAFLQLGTAWNDAQRLREMAQAVPGEVAVLVSAASATDLAGMPVTTPGLFFPSGLTIAGAVLATDLATHPSIHLSALAAERSEAAVRATGADLDGFETLEVTRLAGQLDRFPCAVPPGCPSSATAPSCRRAMASGPVPRTSTALGIRNAPRKRTPPASSV